MPSETLGFRMGCLDFDGQLAHVEQYLQKTFSGTSAPTASIVGPGDWLRMAMVANDSSDGMYTLPAPSFKLDELGVLTLCFRVRVSVANKACILVGLTDAKTESNGRIGGNENGALVLAPTDCALVVLEGEQDLTPLLVGSKNNADFEHVIDQALDFKNNEDYSITMQFYPNGAVGVQVDGSVISSEDFGMKEGLIDPTKTYYAVIAAASRATAYNAEFDYIDWETNRP